jgi:hypothetical protein
MHAVCTVEESCGVGEKDGGCVGRRVRAVFIGCDLSTGGSGVGASDANRLDECIKVSCKPLVSILWPGTVNSPAET